MNNKQKISKKVLSIISGIFAVLTLFFFIQIIVKANTPLMITISSKSDNTDYSDTDDDNDDYNEYDEEDEDIDYDDSEEDEDIDDSDDSEDDEDIDDSDDSEENDNIDSDELSEAYWGYCAENYSQNAESGSQVEVGFYDINDDGVTEMIVSSGKSEADWQCSVCSYEDDEAYLVDSIYGHYDFYEAESGEGIYIVSGHQGFETIKRLTMNKSGDKLITQTISEKSLDPDEDYYSNDNPIEFKNITEELEDY